MHKHFKRKQAICFSETMKFLLVFLTGLLSAAISGDDRVKVLVLTKFDRQYLWYDADRAVTADFRIYSLPYSVTDVYRARYSDKIHEVPQQEKKMIAAEIERQWDRIFDNLHEYDLIIWELETETMKRLRRSGWRAREEKILSFLAKGGKLVVSGKRCSFPSESPLNAMLPVRQLAGRFSYQQGLGESLHHPLVLGIQTDLLKDQIWGQDYEPDKKEAFGEVEILTKSSPDRGCASPCVYGRLKKGGEVVFLASPFFSRSREECHSYRQQNAERPDQQAIWRIWLERIILLLSGKGQKQTEVLLSTRQNAPVTTSAFAIPVFLLNRTNQTFRGDLSLKLSGLRDGDVFEDSAKIILPPGEKQLEIPVKIKQNLLSTHLKTELTFRCADNYASAISYRAVKAGLKSHLTLKRRGAKEGEIITAFLTVENGNYIVRAALTDRKGRVLQLQTHQMKDRKEFRFSMPSDSNGQNPLYFISALIYRNGELCSRVTQPIYNETLWDPRKQFQLSIWSALTRQDDLYGNVLASIRSAGFNSLGYGLNIFAAEQYGMRSYDENIGTETFAVKINQPDWDAVAKEIKRKTRGPLSPAVSLYSLGEESGFGTGWGKRYYWDSEQAPPVAQKFFTEFLRQRYRNDLALLNDAWQSEYRSFSEVPLRKENAAGPRKMDASTQNYAMDNQSEEWNWKAGGTPGRKQGSYLLAMAPRIDSYEFFDWYYQKYCDLVAAERKKTSPVIRTLMSAPTMRPKTDLPNYNSIGLFYPKENSAFYSWRDRELYGNMPGFALPWTHFDNQRVFNALLYSLVADGNLHICAWSAELNFNPDHSRNQISGYFREFSRRMRAIEPILLHKSPAYTPGLLIFTGRQPLLYGLGENPAQSAITVNTPWFSALKESGYSPKITSDINEILGAEVILASFAQYIAPAEADALEHFVKKGGLLITTPNFGGLSEFGNPYRQYPQNEKLAALLGFRLRQTSFYIGNRESLSLTSFPGLSDRTMIPLVSKAKDTILLPDKHPLAIPLKYSDGTPCILVNHYGKGMVVHFNMVYDWKNWWNTFYEPEREGLRRLIEMLLQKKKVFASAKITYLGHDSQRNFAGWTPTVRKGLELIHAGDAVPYWFRQDYQDPSAQTAYYFLNSDHRSPVISAKFKLERPIASLYDLFTRKVLAPAADGTYEISMEPGDCRILAALQQIPEKLSLTLPREVSAGSKMEISVALANGIKACHGILLSAKAPDGSVFEPLDVRNWTVSGGKGSWIFQTAWNDPPGIYKLKAQEPVTGLVAEASFTLISKDNAIHEDWNPYPGKTENKPFMKLSGKAFLEYLKKLYTIYLDPVHGLQARWKLNPGLFVPFLPLDETRHGLVEKLRKVDWKEHIANIVSAIKDGQKFIVTGKDLPDKQILYLLSKERELELERIRVASQTLDYQYQNRRCRDRIPERIIWVFRKKNGAFLYDPVDSDGLFSSEAIRIFHNDCREKYLKILSESNTTSCEGK